MNYEKQHAPIPESGLPEPTVVREKNYNTKSLSVYDVKHIYRSKEEMDKAIKNDEFDIAKTMHIDSNGKFYVLSFAPQKDKDDQKDDMSKVQIYDDKDSELSPTQKLCEMLCSQSMLP